MAIYALLRSVGTREMQDCRCKRYSCCSIDPSLSCSPPLRLASVDARGCRTLGLLNSHSPLFSACHPSSTYLGGSLG